MEQRFKESNRMRLSIKIMVFGSILIVGCLALIFLEGFHVVVINKVLIDFMGLLLILGIVCLIFGAVAAIFL